MIISSTSYKQIAPLCCTIENFCSIDDATRNYLITNNPPSYKDLPFFINYLTISVSLMSSYLSYPIVLCTAE